MKDQRPPQPKRASEFAVYMGGEIQDMWVKEGDAFTFAHRLVAAYPKSTIRIDEMAFTDPNNPELQLVRKVAQWIGGQRTL